MKSKVNAIFRYLETALMLIGLICLVASVGYGYAVMRESQKPEVAYRTMHVRNVRYTNRKGYVAQGNLVESPRTKVELRISTDRLLDMIADSIFHAAPQRGDEIPVFYSPAFSRNRTSRVAYATPWEDFPAGRHPNWRDKARTGVQLFLLGAGVCGVALWKRDGAPNSPAA